MKQHQLIMGMPITVEIIDPADDQLFEQVFSYFRQVDERFSTYKPGSEIMRFNRGEITPTNLSSDLAEVLSLAEKTKQETKGFFDIRRPAGGLDPSGLVKGWAIRNAAEILNQARVMNYFIEAGGDIEARGHNSTGAPWRIGIRNPFNKSEIVKVVSLDRGGIATSGEYERGAHIYNPHRPEEKNQTVASLTVIGPDIYEADRLATAAFAMGRAGLDFLEQYPDVEAYLIDYQKQAHLTSGFARFIIT